MKILFSLFILGTLLFCRENPFQPVENANEISNNNQDEFDIFRGSEVYLPSSARVLKKIKITYQNIDGSIAEIEKEYDKEIDWHNPLEIKHAIEEKKEIENNKFIVIPIKSDIINVSYLNRDLRILTKDKIDKHFFLSQPYRVVIDFKGKFEGIESAQIDGNYFKKVTISGHDGYYRLVAELDSYYKHIITEIEKGYILGIR